MTAIQKGTLHSNTSVTDNTSTLMSETTSKRKHKEPPVLEVIENIGVMDQPENDSNSAGKLQPGSI